MRAVKFSLRLDFSRFKFGYARRFFENHTAVFGFCGHYFFDFALPDYRVTFFAYAALVKQIHNIFQPCGLFVDKIFALAAAVKFTRYYDFVIVYTEYFVAVVKIQRHFAVRKRFPVLRSRKDDVLHARTAQTLCRLFAQNPADCVRNVGFTAAVRSDYARNAVAEFDFRFVGERFKAV